MGDYKKLFILALFLLLAVVIIQFINPNIGEMIISVLTTIATIIGVVAVFFEKLDMLFYENKNTITEDDRKYIVDYL